ncbi:hypothetical protein CEXT_732281 [Caerostris extrusa]|uniref:Uncharacterized protein n=1 Tax=Caerostris extrusa TaxID=172846 RepID=A0AAV4Y3H2_CAEEX|nr:hypothetical protein CEXT_732281 [Caerostris extrusa]
MDLVICTRARDLDVAACSEGQGQAIPIARRKCCRGKVYANLHKLLIQQEKNECLETFKKYPTFEESRIENLR